MDRLQLVVAFEQKKELPNEKQAVLPSERLDTKFITLSSQRVLAWPEANNISETQLKHFKRSTFVQSASNFI